MSRKLFSCRFYGNLRLIIFIQGIKLGNIGLGNKIVYMLLHGIQMSKITAYRRGDNGMMSRDFTIVPGPAPD